MLKSQHMSVQSKPHHWTKSFSIIFIVFLISSVVVHHPPDAEETTQRLHPPARQSASCEISPSTGLPRPKPWTNCQTLNKAELRVPPRDQRLQLGKWYQRQWFPRQLCFRGNRRRRPVTADAPSSPFSFHCQRLGRQRLQAELSRAERSTRRPILQDCSFFLEKSLP